MVYGLVTVLNKYQSSEYQKKLILDKYPGCEIVNSISDALKILKDKDILVVTDILRLYSDADFSESSFDTVFDTVYKNYQTVFAKGADIAVLSCPALDSDIFRMAIMRNLAKGSSSTEMAVSEILEAQIKIFLNELYEKNIKKRESISRSIRESQKTRSRKGIKLNIKKQKPCKEFMLQNLKDFGGELSNDEVMEKLHISRNTFFKYKKELVLTFGTNFNTDAYEVSEDNDTDSQEPSLAFQDEDIDKPAQIGEGADMTPSGVSESDKKKGNKKTKSIDDDQIEGQTSIFNFM